LELIQAFAIVKASLPDARLICVNSIYPGEESEEYYKQCLNEMYALGLEDCIDFYADYLPLEESFRLLSQADLIVYPYYDVGDGASAAVTAALAVKKPMLISKSGIFEDLRGIFPEIEDINPSAIAMGIIENLEESTLEKLSHSANVLASSRSWDKMANLYLHETMGSRTKVFNEK
jgi:glycosyltransferase involved in cell wall biosynthesis